MELVQRMFDLGRSFLDRQPALALALGGALVAVYLTAVFRKHDVEGPPGSLASAIYRQVCRMIWAMALVALAGGAAVGLQSYLHRSLEDFRHSHGRLTEVNLAAVRTIWGDEQVQPELGVHLWWEEEQTERIESEDLSKPAVLRKKTVRHNITTNPFLTTRHKVTLRQNARKKGSAVYAGYETECQFKWLIQNQSDHDVKGQLRLPLPSNAAMFDGLAVSLNGTNVLNRLRVESGALLLEPDLAANEVVDLQVKFQSRGLAYWYFQVREPREVRDFELLLKLPDLPKSKLNYPEGCMTPTEIKATDDGRGSVLAYRLDRAICGKGMGIEMPKLTQPGEVTGAVLAEAEKGWVLLFAAMLLGLTLTGRNHAPLIGVLIGTAVALAYGLVGDLSDTFLGFWGSTAIVLLPVLLGLGWLTKSRWLALELVVFGVLYPCLAGLDDDRQTLYLNICAGLLLVITAWQVLRRLDNLSASAPAGETHGLEFRKAT